VTARDAIITEIEARMRWGIYRRDDQDVLLLLLRGDGGESPRAEDRAPARAPFALPAIVRHPALLVDAV
jgi:hypothetical protein